MFLNPKISSHNFFFFFPGSFWYVQSLPPSCSWTHRVAAFRLWCMGNVNCTTQSHATPVGLLWHWEVSGEFWKYGIIKKTQWPTGGSLKRRGASSVSLLTTTVNQDIHALYLHDGLLLLCLCTVKIKTCSFCTKQESTLLLASAVDLFRYSMPMQFKVIQLSPCAALQTASISSPSLQTHSISQLQ